MRKVYVLYHSPCMDGTAAALAAKMALEKAGIDATYIPVKYGDRPEIEPVSRVYFLDYSWPREDLNKLVEQDCSLIIIDHHKTAAKDLEGFGRIDRGIKCVFDMNKSGAVLAWEFFHGDSVPKFFQYVQNRDLWLWEMPHGEEFSAWLSSYEWSIDVFEGLFAFFEETPSIAFNQGAAILRAQRQQVEAVCKNARWIMLDGVQVIGVNSPILQSEVGARLLELFPDSRYSAVWYTTALGQQKFSLRGRGDFDVSDVAKKFGGGGHANAAGFYMS